MDQELKLNVENKKEPGMARKTKFYMFILLAGVVLTIWAVFYKDQSGSFTVDEDKPENRIETDQNYGEDTISDELGNYLKGRLETSDNPNKGNLKLISSLGEIYIRTKRDFNDLVGSDVLLSINGTLDNFELINIKKRFEKDGYIQSQQ